MPLGQFAPVVDGKVLPAHPFDPVAAPSAAEVPLMIGTNKDEILFMLMKQPELRKCNEEIMRKTLVQRIRFEPGSITVPVEKIDDLIATYKSTRPTATPYDRMVAILSDHKRIGAIRVAERKVVGGPAPVLYVLVHLGKPLFRRHTQVLPYPGDAFCLQ